ncbi:MAG: pyrimidine operon attenuation protein / uracil phosphoribosyltransferase [Bacteroidetes bacterium]|nr:MAG: pyrimidine operon attenuation protein / uracil phosphoribosyltransferase [Bacteroidota bacterium]
MTTERTLVMNSKQVQQRLNRLAWQVYENCWDEKEIIIAGIAPNGFLLAKRIASILESISSIRTKIIEVKVEKDNPLQGPAELSASPAELKDKVVVVIDDVSNSGRTLIYGVKPFLSCPVKSILTLVLVDRAHNRFPVKTNFVGLSLATTLQEHISVEIADNGSDAVYLD